MKVNLQFDYSKMCHAIIAENLTKLEVNFKVIAVGEIEFLERVSDEKLEQLSLALDTYGITIIENQKSVFVQKIKDVIQEMVHSEIPQTVKSSVYLAEKLNYSYGYIANVFSDVTYTSIENFIIIQKIEFAKHLMLNNQLSLTEIAYRLNYSSVAHLSTQFKNTTGLTPSSFQRIIVKRKQLQNQNF